MTTTVLFLGEDQWNRAVFKGDDGHFYKTADLLMPDRFDTLTPAEKAEHFSACLSNLHDTDDFEGEPGYPVNVSLFKLHDSLIETPRGWFKFKFFSMKEAKEAGFGFWFAHEGTAIMADGTHAYAVFGKFKWDEI